MRQSPQKVELLDIAEVHSPKPSAIATSGARSTKGLHPSFLDALGSAHRVSEATPHLSKSVAATGLQGKEIADQVLKADSRKIQAFTLLAASINANLDYPMILIENGMTGTASVDLVFNSEGLIDEERSEFQGTHRLLRGLLVKASREGVVTWYRDERSRAARKELRNQHFRALFTISSTEAALAAVETSGPDSYVLWRRYFENHCLGAAAVDAFCMAMKAKGAIERSFSDEYREQYNRLKEKLDAYDQLGMKRINEKIRDTRA